MRGGAGLCAGMEGTLLLEGVRSSRTSQEYRTRMGREGVGGWHGVQMCCSILSPVAHFC